MDYDKYRSDFPMDYPDPYPTGYPPRPKHPPMPPPPPEPQTKPSSFFSDGPEDGGGSDLLSSPTGVPLCPHCGRAIGGDRWQWPTVQDYEAFTENEPSTKVNKDT